MNVIKLNPELPYRFEQSDFDDESTPESKLPIRTYPDVTTSAFVDTFFSDTRDQQKRDITDRIKWLFVDYTYTYIRSNLLSTIDSYLIDGGQFPLMHGEHVELIYKGGNIMNIFFNLYVKRHIDNAQCLQILNNANVNDSFKVSDVDYSVSIHTKTVDRFEIIKSVVTYALYNIVCKLVNTFESMLEHPTEGRFNNVDFSNETLSTYHSRVDPLNDIYEKIIMNITNKTPFTNANDLAVIDKEITLITQNRRPSDYLIDIEAAILLSKILLVQKYLSPVVHQTAIMNKITQVATCILTINNFKEQQLRSINMYSVERLDRFKSLVRDKLLALIGDNQTHSIYGKVLGEYAELQIDATKLQTQTNPVILSKRISTTVTSAKNVYSQKTPQIGELPIIGKANAPTTHYISYNNFIASRRSTFMVSFDLMRVKFNACLNNIVTNVTKNELLSKHCIPSEFIDISIPNTSDSVYLFTSVFDTFGKYTRYNIKSPSTLLKKYRTMFVGYSPLQVKLDLEIILFIRPNTMQWLAGKAEKRIKRYVLYTIVLDETIQPLSAVTTFIGTIAQLVANNAPNKIIHDGILTNIKPFLKFDMTTQQLDEIVNEYSKTDDFNVVTTYFSKQYEHWKVMLSSILVGSYILHNGADVGNELKFVNKLRRYIKYVPLTQDKLVTQQQEYKQLIITINNTFATLRQCIPNIAANPELKPIDNSLDNNPSHDNNNGQRAKKYKLIAIKY